MNKYSTEIERHTLTYISKFDYFANQAFNTVEICSNLRCLINVLILIENMIYFIPSSELYKMLPEKNPKTSH